jgi:hypothetical protein
MYTIRVDNLDEYKGSDIERDMTDAVNEDLKQHGIQVKGICKFPMKSDTFILVDALLSEPREHGRIKSDLLGPDDWLFVNQAVNNMLDKFNFCAKVRSRNFMIRDGKRRKL